MNSVQDARAPRRPWDTKLGRVQKLVMHLLEEKGTWSPNSGTSIQGDRNTEIVLQGLVARGLVRMSMLNGQTVYEPTDAELSGSTRVRRAPQPLSRSPAQPDERAVFEAAYRRVLGQSGESQSSRSFELYAGNDGQQVYSEVDVERSWRLWQLARPSSRLKIEEGVDDTNASDAAPFDRMG